MTQLVISNVTGLTIPYQIYICDVYGNNCAIVATVNTAIPPMVTITLPSQFNMSPAIGVLVKDLYCERFIVLNCVNLPPVGKQFQDGDYFFFMDYSIYQFQ
jgi:hypothetical protein